MVNNSDKSKAFYQNDFHVGGNPWVEIPMSAYEPKHHSVEGPNICLGCTKNGFFTAVSYKNRHYFCCIPNKYSDLLILLML